MERFDILKNAPVESYAKSMKNISFQPVGKVIRNVQCLRCKQWGHEIGDRECPNRDLLPSEQAKHLLEDPMAGYTSQAGTNVAMQSSEPAIFEAREDEKGWGGIQFPDFTDPRRRKRSRSVASSSSSISRPSTSSSKSSITRKKDHHSRKHHKHKKHRHRNHKKHHHQRSSSKEREEAPSLS
jgi:CBF1 interacting corepressor